ncbi:MAG: hypothetical protein KF774_10630 [Planctomyces sp.]|nr:hypothetical protein [Planctomyces sp.]
MAVIRNEEIPLDALDMTAAELVRERLDEPAVERYAEVLREGGELPKLRCFERLGRLLCGDGRHRLEAHRRAGRETIAVTIEPGGPDDALRVACHANAAHGLPRSNADKRRTVELALRHSEWGRMSDGAVAQLCAVSREFVNRVRRAQPVIDHMSEVSDMSAPPPATTRIGRDGVARVVPVQAVDRRARMEPERPQREPGDESEYDRDPDPPMSRGAEVRAFFNRRPPLEASREPDRPPGDSKPVREPQSVKAAVTSILNRAEDGARDVSKLIEQATKAHGGPSVHSDACIRKLSEFGKALFEWRDDL